MHYSFVLKCKFPDGRIDYYAWMVEESTQKQAEKYVTEVFERENVYGPTPKEGRPLAKIEDLIYVAETASNDYDETVGKCFEKAERKAAALLERAQGAEAPAVEKSKGAA